MHKRIALLGTVLLASACSDPDCLADEVKVGTTCRNRAPKTDAATEISLPDDAAVNPEPSGALGSDGGQPVEPTSRDASSAPPFDDGPPVPGAAANATLGTFVLGAGARAAGELRVWEDGFEYGEGQCAGQLCVNGRFEP